MFYVALVGRGGLLGDDKPVPIDYCVPFIAEMALARFLDQTGFHVNAGAWLLNKFGIGRVRRFVLVAVLETSYSFCPSDGADCPSCWRQLSRPL